MNAHAHRFVYSLPNAGALELLDAAGSGSVE